MNKFLAPLATLAFAGLAACSGNPPANNAADTAIESNLTTVDEQGTNDSAFGNDATLLNDSDALVDPTLNATIADPALNTTANATGL